ncbi:hypothetical protein Gasu2_17960 [Galdieria sulphuraria]|nr:hypothetical protein Gasu2_17960 [Galdieria sulphuraria]
MDQNSQYYQHWKQLQNERSTLETIARISEWLWEDMDYSLSKRVFVELLKTTSQIQLSVDSVYRGMKCLDSEWLSSDGVTPEELFKEVFSSAVVELLNDLMMSVEHAEQHKGWTPWQIGRCKHLLSILSKALMQQGQQNDQDPIMSSSPSTAWEQSLLPSEEEDVALEQNTLLYKQTLEKCLERVRSWVQNLRQTVIESEWVHFNSLILELMELAIQLEQLHDLENKETDSKQWKWWKLMNEMTEMLSSQENDSSSVSLLQHLSNLDRNIVENEVDAANAIMEELFPLCQTIHDYRILNAFIITLDHVGNFITKEQSHFRQVVFVWLEKLIQLCQDPDNAEGSYLIISITQYLGNFAKMGLEQQHIERMLANLFEKRPLLASVLGVVSGYPSLCKYYVSQLERLAPQEPVDLSILPLVKKWVLEDTSHRLICVGRSWLFAVLVPSLLQEKEEILDNILGILVDAGLMEQAGLLYMEKEAIHPAFRNRHSAIALMKRYYITRLKEMGTNSNPPDLRKHFCLEWNEIYPPSEDTFLLVDAVLSDKRFVQSYFQPFPSLVVESILYLATDIQYTALHSFKLKATGHIFEVIQSDLLTSLRPTDDWMCIFNPPYVSTDEEEYKRGQTEHSGVATWAGGILGRQVIDRFCEQLCETTTNSHRVLLYLLLVDTNCPSQVLQFLRDKGNFVTLQLVHRRVGWESIRVYRCWKTFPPQLH